MFLNKATPEIQLLNEMANSIVCRKALREKIEHVQNGNNYIVELLKNDTTLIFAFYGFGDLMGYYIRAISSKIVISEGRIGINDEAVLYVPNSQNKNIQVVISPNVEPSSYY